MLRLTTKPRGVVLLTLLPILFGGCSDPEAERESLAEDALAVVEQDYGDTELEAEDRRAAFVPRYDSVATEFWGTRAGLEARLNHLYHARYDMPEVEKDSLTGVAADLILAWYADSEHLTLFTDWLHLFNDEQEEAYLQRLLDESPHPEVRAAAIFEPTYSKKAYLRYGRIEDTAAAEAEIAENLNVLLTEYHDTPKGGSTYGALADALLNTYTDEELAIGQPAPEIVGQTVDGEEILLSQFKGKVTVFYFWGDW